MSGFVRPEISDAVYRWREIVVGLPTAAIGLWLAATSYGALFLIGCGFAAGGAALVVAGIQRGRFRSAERAAGVVQIDERQITYFGPFGGGAVAVEDVRSIAVDPERKWVLTDASHQTLTIPMGAEGAEELFDAFTALPGVTGRALIEAKENPVSQRTIIWEKPQARLH